MNGTCRAVDSSAHAPGKQTNIRTTTRMSQTWLASQMGPMACAMSVALGARPRPRRKEVPHAAAEIGSRAERVER